MLPFATWLRQQERLCLEEKGRKESVLVGHQKVPHGYALSGDHSGDTVDGAGTEGLPEPGLLLLFLRYGLGKGEKEGLCN